MNSKQRKVQWVTARRNRRKYHPRTKVKPVSRLTLGSLKNLMGEVRKCQVLCKNCHAIKSSVLELHKHGQGHNVY